MVLMEPNTRTEHFSDTFKQLQEGMLHKHIAMGKAENRVILSQA